MLAAQRAPSDRDEKDEELNSADEQQLIRVLRTYRQMAMKGEGARKNRDKRGTQLANSIMWKDTLTQAKLPITVPATVQMIERIVGMVTKYAPVPMVEPVAGSDEAGATYIQGALVTNWKYTRMTILLRQAALLAAFTRPCAIYRYWDQTARKGIGECMPRIIPGYRLIVDDRYFLVRDMEFAGVRERCTRAKLIRFFPRKAEAIEKASQRAEGGGARSQSDIEDNPLRISSSPTGQSADRLYSVAGQPYVGTKTIPMQKNGRGKDFDPMKEEVEVEYLWIDDPTPISVKKPKLDSFGHQLFRYKREENGDPAYHILGTEMIQTEFGPVEKPKLEAVTEPVYETVVEKKYKSRRFCAWIPQDDLLLGDLDWDGPVPLSIVRDSIPLDGFWSTGTALRLETLAVALNVIYTIIFQRLKLSLSGTWLATPGSGLKRNKLSPEDGQVFYAKKIDADNIKQFKTDPIDPAYFALVKLIKDEMRETIGMSDPMQGNAAGRADSPATYDKLLEAGGVSVVSRGQLLEYAVEDDAEIQMWHFKNFYTEEHQVLLQTPDGNEAFAQFNTLLAQGDFAVRIDTGSLLAHSESVGYDRAKELLGLGIYTKPTFVEVAKIPHGKRALELLGRLAQDPTKAYLMGPAAGGQKPASTPAVKGSSSQPRSHHAAPHP